MHIKNLLFPYSDSKKMYCVINACERVCTEFLWNCENSNSERKTILKFCYVLTYKSFEMYLWLKYKSLIYVVIGEHRLYFEIHVIWNIILVNFSYMLWLLEVLNGLPLIVEPLLQPMVAFKVLGWWLPETAKDGCTCTCILDRVGL